MQSCAADADHSGTLGSFTSSVNGCGTEMRAKGERRNNPNARCCARCFTPPLPVIPHQGLTLLIPRGNAVVHRELVQGTDLYHKRIWGCLLWQRGRVIGFFHEHREGDIHGSYHDWHLPRKGHGHGGYVFSFSKNSPTEVWDSTSPGLSQWGKAWDCWVLSLTLLWGQQILVEKASSLISLGSPGCFAKRRGGFQFPIYSTFQRTCLTKQLSERCTQLQSSTAEGITRAGACTYSILELL